MAGKKSAGEGGAAVDSQGRASPDPTKNVLDLVEAAVLRLDDLATERQKRQDDLRVMTDAHAKELGVIRQQHSAEMRHVETARLNAIRDIDQNQVQRSAEVIADAQQTLVAQVAAAAEAMRSTTAAAATVQATALDAKIAPLQSAIGDLQRFQFEAQGQRTQVVETRDVASSRVSTGGLVIGAVVGLTGLLLTLVTIAVTVYALNR